MSPVERALAIGCGSIDYTINNRASSGETLYIQSGTYNSQASSVATITKSVSLSGGWDASFSTQNGFSVIDGEGTRRGVLINDVLLKVTIDHFIVQNGISPSSGQGGGGILNTGTLVLNNSVIRFNDDVAVYSSGPKLSISNSSISHNTNTYHSRISQGAGLYITGTVDINNTTIANNVIDPIITGGNTYPSYGGGIYVTGGNITINNSTIANNSSFNGGGIYHSSGIIIINNSILANNAASNSAPDCTYINVSNHNVIGNVSGCNRMSSTGDQVNVDPLISPLPVGLPGYFPISSSSPAKNTGELGHLSLQGSTRCG